VRRGEIWTAAAGGGYIGKPRPVVIVQDDRFDATHSVTICALTTDATEAPLFRLAITPDSTNQMREVSRLMVDKLTTVPRSKLGELVGRLSDEDMVRLGRAIVVFLGLAGPSDTTGE
jgi:mRNA interferase MazF